MLHIYGIIFLERTEIIIRIYEVNKLEWKLIHSENFSLQYYSAKRSAADEISSNLANFFTTDHAQYVTQWKTASRGISQPILNYISSSLGLEIENISLVREQELLCKGLFTELW